jgi:hypothetical protein
MDVVPKETDNPTIPISSIVAPKESNKKKRGHMKRLSSTDSYNVKEKDKIIEICVENEEDSI